MKNDPKLLEMLLDQERGRPACQLRDEDGHLTLRGLTAGLTRANSYNDDRYTSEAMVSRSGLDRYDTILEPDGWQLDNFRKVPGVYFNHADWDLPIGQSLDITKQSDGLRALTQFAVMESPDRVGEVWRLHRGGYLRAWSVSFWPLEWEEFKTDQGDGNIIRGVRFIRNELLEYSLVGIPGHPDTLTLSLARVAVATARSLGRKIPESKFTGDLGLLSRAQMIAGDTTLTEELEDASQSTMRAIERLRAQLNEHRLAPGPDASAAIEAARKALETFRSLNAEVGATRA